MAEVRKFTFSDTPVGLVAIFEKGVKLYKLTLLKSLPFSIFSSILIFLPQLIHDPDQSKLINYDLATRNLIITIFCWICSLPIIAAMIFRIYCAGHNLSNDFFNTIKHTISRLLAIIAVNILYIIIVFAGSMLLIIPGLILSVSLMFSLVLCVIQNRPLMQNLLVSHRLVWGNWWRTGFIISVPFLLNLIISLSFFTFMVRQFLHLGLDYQFFYIGSFTINVIIQSIFLPFTFSIVVVLLHDLMVRETKKKPDFL